MEEDKSKNNQESKKEEPNRAIKMAPKEIVLNRAITENDIEEINKMAPVIISLRNTRGLSASVLAKLDSSISIRISGAFDERMFPQYANDKYLSKTLYSPSEISKVIEILDGLENNIDPEWSDLEKATYSYITLMRDVLPIREGNLKEESQEEQDFHEDRPLAQLINKRADAVGFAFILKEVLERNGIPCRYYQNGTGNAWNEILIDGEYYPADLFLDALANERTLETTGEFDLRSFLSDKEFYNTPGHQKGKEFSSKQEETPVLDDSEVQKALDKVLTPREKKEIPKIPLKSAEFQKIFETDEIAGAEDFSKISELKLSLDGQETEAIKEDLTQIAEFYPEALENVTLSNTSGTHVDMQELINAIYEGRSKLKQEERVSSSPSQITIESSVPEDFDLDFSKAPKIVIDEDTQSKIEDVSYSQKISFVNTSNVPIKAPNLDGKIPGSIDTINLRDFDLNGFSISSSNVNEKVTGILAGAIRLELEGGGTQGIADIGDLSNVTALSVNGLASREFDDVMDLSIKNDARMPRLFDLTVQNQSLAGRAILSEITNPNIVNLHIVSCNMDNITGLDQLKNQLICLLTWNNNISVEDLRKISEISNEKSPFRRAFYGSKPLNARIDSLSGDVISDETYNYLDSFFRRSGYEDYRSLRYGTYADIQTSKKEMLKDFSKFSLEKVPYFIEDAKLMREILPYTTNPMMVKDLTTFEQYLNDPSNYFEQDYLKDGTLWLTKEQLDALINSGKTIPQKISLKINTVAELSKSELKTLKNSCSARGINLIGVNVFDDRYMDPTHPDQHNFDEIDTHLATYEISEYESIRNKLDEIVDKINPSMSDAEKFAAVYYRLAHEIPLYNYSAVKEPLSKEHAIYQAERCDKVRNLSEGLIAQKGFDLSANAPDDSLFHRSVCAGYADILKNALALAGVECIIDSGDAVFNKTKNKPEGGHEWNKVKIDGKWYYTDLCWDAGKASYSWALRGARTFEHSNYYKTENPGTKNEELKEVRCHLTCIKPGERHEQAEQEDFDQTKLKEMFYKVKTGEIFRNYEITIPPDPNFSRVPSIDVNRIKDEYKRRKDDMLAKYYGDRNYKKDYDEIAARYRENEVEVTDAGITYRTVQDYPEREDDEKFLILGEYKNALERMTKYEAGAAGVYLGNASQIDMQYKKDKEYVETRNYTFDQHKNTQKDLATLGKFGETLPYIPKQTGIVKNGLRVVGNVGIFARNLVAPAYRFVGKHVAQPFHRLVTGGKDASPYRNNPYHRFVARRDYFKDIGAQNDAIMGKRHPIRNYIMSNVNAIAKYREGNEAVLNAGAYDIQNNLKQQEMQKTELTLLNSKKIELESQIAYLETEIRDHADAKNINIAQNSLAAKKKMLQGVEKDIISVSTIGKIVDSQTDAVSQTQHDIASKEVNTYRVAVIKGVAKLGVKKFIGPKIENWLLEHTKQRVKVEEKYNETIYIKDEVKDPSTTVPITETRPDYDIEVDDLIEKAKGRTVKMYESVSGGNRGEISYTISGDEACTGFHFQDGTTWGTGYSSNVPLMTDQTWPASFLDASNNLRDNLTFSEIASAISSGELSPEMLENMTIQVGNQGWVYASELFEGVTKEVEVGTKVIEGATHTELIPQIVERTKDVYNIVNNQRVVNALNTLGITLDAVGKVDTAYNIEEILRKTGSDVQTNKKSPRKYEYDDSEFYR